MAIDYEERAVTLQGLWSEAVQAYRSGWRLNQWISRFRPFAEENGLHRELLAIGHMVFKGGYGT